MSRSRIFCKIICLVLCMSMFMQGIPGIGQQGGVGSVALVTYVKDIKLIYADSVSEARDKVPEGYFLYDENINDGTGALGVYICYSTTTEVADAVTDIRVMNEDGGFDRGTFNDKMDQALEMLQEQAEALHKAITDEYIPNLEKGLPGAKYAHDQLNVFMYDENTPLGDYIKAGKLTVQDLAKMLLVCHNTIISSIMSLIAQGLQREDGKDWLDNLEKMDPSKYELNGTLQKEYKDLIDQIQPALNDFSDQYNIMVYTDDVRDSMTPEQVNEYSEDLANEDVVQWWYKLWEILNSHDLAGDSGLTAESVLVEWYLGESVANHKICMLIDAMTEGQRTMLGLIGPVNLIMNDLFDEKCYQQTKEDLAPIKEENGTVSLWAGVDTDIFTSEVGITSVAYDEMVTANNYNIFTGEKNVLKKTAQDYISIISNYSSLVFSIVSVLTSIALLTKGYTGTAVAIKVLAKIGLWLSKGLLGAIFTYAPFVVLGLCLLASLIVWIIKEIQAGKVPEHDRTTIPKYMVDSVTDKNGAQRYEIYKRVDNVQSDSQLKNIDGYGLNGIKNMCGADINANKGYHWAALYISKNTSVGNPIEADFKIVSGFADAPVGGYVPLRHFNKKTEAVDLNAVDDYKGQDESLYMYYKSEALSENHTVYRYIRNISVSTVSLLDPKGSGKYVFSEDEAIGVAKKRLTEMGYYVINHNFSDNPDYVTFIGWNGTDDPEYAIKDVRLVYNSTVGRAGSGTFGTFTYGNMGNINKWSLFVCRGSQNPAPPVTDIKIVYRNEDPSATRGISLNAEISDEDWNEEGNADYGIGWEPVNEFTGGDAIPLGKLGVQFYFMGEEVFIEGPDYVAGIEIDTYIANFGHGPAHNCCHVDIWNNTYAAYQKYKITELGEKFFDFSIYASHRIESVVSISSAYHLYSNNNPECGFYSVDANTRLRPRTTTGVKYTLTKNPYRAIYGVTSKTTVDTSYRDSFMRYDGFGYAITPIEVTISMADMTIEPFDYEKHIKKGLTFYGKTLFLEDREYHSEGIAVNVDITQSTFLNEHTSWNNMYVMGYTPNRTPLTVDDFLFSKTLLDESEYPDNFTPIPYMGGTEYDYTNLSPMMGKASVRHEESSTKHYVDLFDDFYGYVRSEINENDVETLYSPSSGKYISNLFLASKEKIRVESLLGEDKDAECEDISYTHLISNLLSQGATMTFDKNIGTDYYNGGNDNANTIYLGITRTNDIDQAIRDIRFYVCDPKEEPPKTIDATVTINGKEQVVKYYLVSDASITSKANLDCKKVLDSRGIEIWEETELMKERQAYLYATWNKTAFPDPIVDVNVTTWCSFGTYEPLLTFDDKSFYTVKQESNVNLHIKDAWFEGGNQLCFKRQGNEDLYVSELKIKTGGNGNRVVASLIEEGYSVVNMDLNHKAGGSYVYIGVKYTSKKEEAITNLHTKVAKNSSEPKNSYTLTNEKHQYYIVSKTDLNDGIGDKYIYLYYTKDPGAGEPLVDLYAAKGIKEFTDSIYSHDTVKELDKLKYSNLNDGTWLFATDIYLIMKRPESSGKYISEISVAYGWSKDGAVEKLQNNGFGNILDKDLNDGTGSSQWIYLGYKRTDNPEYAIRDIVVSVLKKDTLEYEGITYYLASDVNLNRHCLAFSKDIYLYYTTDPEAGDPITSLYCSSTPVEKKKDEQGYHRTVASAVGYNYGTDYADLNEDAGGDYIYLIMVSNPEHSLISSMFGNGSWLVIGIFVAGVILVVTGVIFYKKKKERIIILVDRLNSKLFKK